MGQKANPIGNRLGIIRGWDSNWYGGRNYSDKLVEGSPKNSTSTVPIMPWGATTDVAKCADWVE